MATSNDAADEVLDRLAEFESASQPVLSLYLDLRPQERVSHKTFLDTAAKEHPDLEPDLDRIRAYLKSDVDTATRTLAVFSCSGENQLFEALQFEGDIDGHRLYVDREPHVFPLARLVDQYGPYAALLVNTNSARLYVFSAGAAQRQQTVRNKKGKRVSAGGWSQARYQRRLENLHHKHIKDVTDAVERIIDEEHITRILVAAD